MRHWISHSHGWDEWKDAWHEKKPPGSHTFQPINIVTEAVSAKMSKFFFLMGGNTNRWKQQVGLQAQPEGPVLN